MSEDSKLRVVTDYEKLSETTQEQIKLSYPYGFSDNLITFLNKDGNKIKGLRFETDEKIYLIRMTAAQADIIIDEDDDYDDDGNLHEDVKEDYEDKYSDLDHMKTKD